MQGLFITFEGIDKSGKTTLAELLVDTLRAKGHQVVLTKEPGGTALGEDIRHLVLDPRDEPGPCPAAEVLLFAADRAQHVDEVIRPALASGKVVVSDRFTDSTLAYQGYGRGFDLAELKAVMQTATGGLEPGLTVLVDVDLATARQRGWGKDPDRLESGSHAFFERVRSGFLSLCEATPDRYCRVDGRLEVEDLAGKILDSTLKRLR